jgi:2-oxoglutarate dehydrogenase E2 component (dihydrolipoamide succinyltransferase)
MALVDVRVPEGEQEGSTSTLTRWLVAAGARVAAHAPIAEIETDKVVVELAAPAAGVVRELLKQEGDALAPGELLARIEAGAAEAPAGTRAQPASAAPPPRPAASAPAGARDERLSPAVRSLLKQYGLDAAQITGTGRDGRVTADDVLAYRAKQGAAGGGAGAGSPAGGAALAGHRVPHDAMRRRIAQHMVESLLRTSPHVTSVFEADLGAALAHREANKRAWADRGVRLTLTAYFVHASCRALQAVPEVNARWHEDALEIYEDVNIGVGTALGDRGLIVPVIRRVQTLDLEAIARRLDELTRAAREGSLAPADVQGGTFTISNHGVGGSLLAAPIVINQPQVAILGVGKVEKRAVVVEEGGQDRIVARPMAYVTLSIDHRALDAHQTNRFLSALVEALEGW